MRKSVPRRSAHLLGLALLLTCAFTVSTHAQATAPVAVNDAYTVKNPSHRIAAAKGVLVNDTGAAISAMTAVLVGNASHGTVTLKTTGEFTYKPNAGYYGSDSFTYKAMAGGLSSNVATVSLTVEYEVKNVFQVPITATVANPNTNEYVRINATVKHVSITTWNYEGKHPVWYYSKYDGNTGNAIGLTSGLTYSVTVDIGKHDVPVPVPPFDWYFLRPMRLKHPVTGNTMVLMFGHKAHINADGTTALPPPITEKNIFVFRDGTPNRAYITNTGADTVTVVDTVQKKITKTIPVGDAPDGIAVNPTSSFVYVANSGSDTVSVINIAGNTVAATIPVGDDPRRLVVNPLGTRLYVTNAGSNSVSVVDTATNSVIDTIDAADGYAGSSPGGVTVNPLGTHLYVANAGSNSVSVIDTSTNTNTGTIPLPGAPGEVAISPDGNRLCVTIPLLASVAIIDAASNSMVALVPVGLNPSSVAVRTGGDWAYVTNTGSNSITVIDLATGTLVATIVNNVGQGPTAADIKDNGLSTYFVNSVSGTLQEVKIHQTYVVKISHNVVTTIPAGPSPSRMVLLF